MVKTKRFIDGSDYQSIQAEVGRSFKVVTQNESSGDAYGQPVYVDSGSKTYCGIIQDLDTDDVQQEPGILSIGDKWLFTDCSVSFAATDVIEIDSARYRTVERTSETVDSPTAVFKAYVIRKLIT